MKRLLLSAGAALAVLALVALLGGYAALRWYERASQDPAFFEDAIRGFEAEDREAPPTPGDVVFVGSSSIRLWSTLAEDMAPLRVRNRGFGGSQMRHVAHYAQRIVSPGAPSAVVVYAGDNDLAGGTGKRAEDVVDDFRSLLEVVRAEAPEAHVYVLSIKPSRLRWERWPEMDRANRALEALARAAGDVTFVDVATPLLGPDGRPRPELFRFDRLHLSDQGYEVWASVLRPLLLRDLGGAGPPGTAPEGRAGAGS